MFCITNEEDDIFDYSRHTFSHWAMWDVTKEMMFVDISEFHHLASQVELPPDKLTFFFAVGRSGSTLIGKILNKVPNIKIISQPWCFNHINMLFQEGLITHEELLTKLNSAMKIICLKYEKNCLLKFSSYQCGLIHELTTLFPHAISIFSCRAPGPSIKSREIALLRRFRKTYPGENFVLKKGLPFPRDEICTPAMREHKHFLWTSPKDPQCDGEDGATLYALSIWHYLRNKDKISLVIHYEDLVSNPREVILELLKMLNISIDFLEPCLVAMDRDSQEGLVIRASKSKVAQVEDFSRLRQLTRKVFDIYGIHMSETASCEEVKHFLESY